MSATPAKPTRYEISERLSAADVIKVVDGDTTGIWRPVSVVEAPSARAALKQFIENKPASFTGGSFRAVPVSNITQVDAKIETQRKLTLA